VDNWLMVFDLLTWSSFLESLKSTPRDPLPLKGDESHNRQGLLILKYTLRLFLLWSPSIYSWFVCPLRINMWAKINPAFMWAKLTQHFEQFKISTCEPAFWTIQDINMWTKINPAFMWAKIKPAFWAIPDIRIFSFLYAAISHFSPKIFGLLYAVIIKYIKRARYITIVAYNIYFIF
jgi:hypothetical protein